MSIGIRLPLQIELLEAKASASELINESTPLAIPHSWSSKSSV